MTRLDFFRIEKALRMLPTGEAFNALHPEDQKTIIDAEMTMVRLTKKRKADNERTAKYIADKRKTNPNYARSKVDD